MSGSINKVILVGNVGKEPEVRFTSDGSKVATFSLATSEYWKDKTSGERKDRTEWHKVAVFNDRLVEVIEKFVKKGAKLYLEGQLQTRKWTDQQGQERYTTEVVLSKFRGELTMLDGRSSGGEMGAIESSVSSPFGDAASMVARTPLGATAPVGAAASAAFDDEIPF